MYYRYIQILLPLMQTNYLVPKFINESTYKKLIKIKL